MAEAMSHVMSFSPQSNCDNACWHLFGAQSNALLLQKALYPRILLHLLHVQLLRHTCVHAGSQNRVIGTAPVFAPGSACLLTVALTFFLLHSTTALYQRRAVSSRYNLLDEACLMLHAGQHTCWNSGKCVQHHPVWHRYCLPRVCV